MSSQQWGSRAGFILAAVGSAIGLGNIWRFPYMAFDNGGGAFLIPYFFALLTAGIPIMILEFSFGHRMKGGAPLAFARLRRSWEWLGWWQVLVSFVIAVYYVAVIGWAISYIGFGFTQAWGDSPVAFFTESYLGMTDRALELGGLRLHVLIPILAAWGVTLAALLGGVRRGIEIANKIFMPVLIVMLLVILVRGVTLPGAVAGLNLLFQPDFSSILDASVWVDAYGQIFFTLSIAFGIMLTYSSYLPRKSDLINNGFMTALLNAGFSILSGIAVFSIIGFMMGQAGGELPANLDGVMLAFVTIPTAISQLPTLNALIGVLFFVSLTIAGLSSLISINEVVVRSLVDKLNAPRRQVIIVYILIAAGISVIFATGAGLAFVDIVDHFINNFGIVMTGLIEVLLLGWLVRLNDFREHANELSDFAIGGWWNFMIKIVTPLVLGVTAVQNLIQDLTGAYGDYEVLALVTLGWSLVVLTLIGAFIISFARWGNPDMLRGEREEGGTR
jgi:NSS family neurotransmitter:Na+ symporter